MLSMSLWKEYVKFMSIKPLRFVKSHENISKDRSQRRTHGYSIKSFLSSFLVIFRLGLWLKTGFIAKSMLSWSGILLKRLATW